MSTKRRNTMNRRATLAMTAVSLAFVGVALIAGDGIGYAQQRPDSDNVNTAINAFHAALANLDIGKMQSVWAQEPYVVLINPRDKAPAVGWNAVKKDWQERVFEFWAELKLSPKQARSSSQLYHRRDASLRKARRSLAYGFPPRIPGARIKPAPTR